MKIYCVSETYELKTLHFLWLEILWCDYLWRVWLNIILQKLSCVIMTNVGDMGPKMEQKHSNELTFSLRWSEHRESSPRWTLSSWMLCCSNFVSGKYASSSISRTNALCKRVTSSRSFRRPLKLSWVISKDAPDNPSEEAPENFASSLECFQYVDN